MNVLIVGAGAVGQVYGRHFQRGGADVAYLVKPEHLDETRRGFTLYPLNDGRPPPPVRFEGFEALTDVGGRKLDLEPAPAAIDDDRCVAERRRLDEYGHAPLLAER